MGLDIYVKRICKKEESKGKYDRFSLVDNDGSYLNIFPSWTRNFETVITEKLYDYKKYKEETGLDIDEYNILNASYGAEDNYLEVVPKNVELPMWNGGEGWKDNKEYQEAYEKIITKINLDNFPTYDKEIKVVYYKEIGYQRNGFNSRFYDDYRNEKIGYFVWDKNELERYKNDYCYDDFVKEHFQRYIIDNFEEGKDCVTFNW